jgi:hypothetical protein
MSDMQALQVNFSISNRAKRMGQQNTLLVLGVIYLAKMGMLKATNFDRKLNQMYVRASC